MNLFGDDDEVEIDLEEYPEAKEPGQPPHSFSRPPREMTVCLGHKAVEKNLLDLHRSGHMPHALIFSGPAGIGKSTMVFRFAKFLVSKAATLSGAAFLQTLDTAASDPAARLVTSGAHPDVITVEPRFDTAKGKKKQGVDVEEIRKIAPFLRHKASQGGWRIAVIDDADTMTRSAQNAVLKILEEPPDRVVIILITHRLQSLIPTIRSRCRVMPFQPLDIEALTDLFTLAGHTLSTAEIYRLHAMSNGSFQQALSFMENGGLEMEGRINALLSACPNWRWTEIHALSEQLARPEEESGYELFERLLFQALFQMARRKARGASSPQDHHAPPDMLISQTPLESLLEVCDRLSQHFRKVRYNNLDRRHGVIGAFETIGSSCAT